MQRLKNRGLTTDLQILDNEASQNYKDIIKDKWGVYFQLVKPDIHRSDAAEQEIRTFKARFLAVLSGVAPDFPQLLWDLLLVKTEMTLNLLRQSTFNRTISAWEYFDNPFQYDATPLGPLGMNVMIHKNAFQRHSWDFRGKDGWSVGAAMDHYCCQKGVSKYTKTEMVSNTIEFRHCKLILPSVTPEYKVLHGVHQLTSALKNTIASTVDAQPQAIKALQDTIEHWEGYKKSPMFKADLPRRTLSTNRHRAPRVPTAKPGTPPAPRVKSPHPRAKLISTKNIPANYHPIAQRLRSQLGPKQLKPVTVKEQPVAHCNRYRTTQKI